VIGWFILGQYAVALGFYIIGREVERAGASADEQIPAVIPWLGMIAMTVTGTLTCIGYSLFRLFGR